MSDESLPAGSDERPGPEGEVLPFPTAPGERDDQVAADLDAGGGLPVDPELPPTALGPVWERPAERRPVLPAWVTDAEQRWAAVRWAADRAWHAMAFHTVRLPVYAGRLVAYSPRGVGRVLAGTLRWAVDAETAGLRRDASWRGEPREYVAMLRHRAERVQIRLVGLLLGLLLLAAALVVLTDASALVRLLATAGVVAGLGWVGRRPDRPVVSSPTVTTTGVAAPRLTSEAVVAALGSLGIGGINQALAKDPRAIGFVAPITRDGAGWRADINLPAGVTVGEVADRRDKLASALARPLGCVWLEGNAEVHPGRLTLWVGDEDLARARQRPWPLAESGAVDLFAPFPFGTDQRGRLVTLTLMFAAMVVGSIPRMGKTFAVRLILLAGALDPRAELHIYELKGTGDLSPLEGVAHRYRAGEEGEDVAYGLAGMRELQAELRRRTKVIRGLPRQLCPENKVTPELASRRSLRLHPILLAVDECQKWFEHPTHGAELTEIAEDLVRRGPAAGIITVFATQRPDAKSLPTGISGNAVLRFCLKVMGHTENDMVLGTSAHKNGIRATLFSRRDRGIGLLVGEADDPRVARTFYVDGPAAEAIATRARAARQAACTLSGHALGLGPDAAAELAAANLLDDLLAVIPADEPKVWSETAVGRLAELRPEVYIGWRPEQLAAALKPHGVPVGRQVWGTDPATGKGANRKGVHREDITTAVAERDRVRRAC